MVQNFILYLFISIGCGITGLAKAQHQILKSKIPEDIVLKKAIENCKRLSRENKYDSLQIIIQKNLPLAIRLNDSLSIGVLKFMSGSYYRGKDNYPKAIQILKESIIILKKLNDLPNLAAAMYTLNKVYADDGNKKEAIRMGLENLKFFEKNQLYKQLASTQSLLSAIYTDLKSYKIAKHFENEFLKNRSKNPEGEFVRFNILADNYEKQKNYKAQWQYLYKAENAARRMSLSTAHIETFVKMAHNLLIRNRVNEALPYLQKASLLAKSINSNFQLNNVYREMALVQLKLGNDDGALSLMKEALILARKDQNYTHVLPTLLDVVYVEKKTGHYKEALVIMEEINNHKDSLLNKETLKITADLNAKYDLEKKESNIALLNKENRLQAVLAKASQIKMRASEQKTYFLFSIVFMLSLLVLVIAYFYYKSQKLRTQLASQQDILKVQAKELAESNLLKDKMFSIISHDLRSPVGSLKANLTLLNSKNRNDTQLIQFEQQVDFLQYTLDNVLYWSLSQQEAISMMPQVVDLFEIVEEVAVSLSGLMRIKDINLILHQTSVPLLVDEQLLTIVLRNILHNAIKFTPKNGSIAMSILSDGLNTQIQIKDTGVGFSSENDRKSRQHGTGLGLNLSRELMKRNNGELKISSIPNEGTTVQLCWENHQEYAYDTMLAESS